MRKLILYRQGFCWKSSLKPLPFVSPANLTGKMKGPLLVSVKKIQTEIDFKLSEPNGRNKMYLQLSKER